MTGRRDVQRKRLLHRRARMRVAAARFACRYCHGGFPGLGGKMPGRRPVSAMSRTEEVTGTIGGRPRTPPRPAILDDPELSAALFGEVMTQLRQPRRPSVWEHLAGRA